MRYLYYLVLLLLLPLSLSAGDAIDDVMTAREASVGKAQASLQDAVTKLNADLRTATQRADATAIQGMERLVRRSAQRGETAEVANGWKQILLIDRNHAEARAFFTAIGTLDAVLAELDGPPVVETDFLGNPITPAPDAGAATNPAAILAAVAAQQVTLTQGHPRWPATADRLALGVSLSAGEGNTVLREAPQVLIGRPFGVFVGTRPINAAFSASQGGWVLALSQHLDGLPADAGWLALPDVVVTAMIGGRSVQSLKVYAVRLPAGGGTVRTNGMAALVW